jgi:hypothetical protein
MPPRPFTHRFSPFMGGQNTVRDPQALASGQENAPEEGFRVIGAELRSGLLRGAFGPGSAISAAPGAIAALTRFIFYVEGLGWVTRSMDNALVRQNWGVRDNGTRHDGSTGNVTYLTAIASDGTPSVPRIHYGGANYQMGLDSPTTAPTSSAAAGTNVQYAYTWAIKDGSTVILESNPSARSSSYAAGGTVTFTASPDSRVTHTRVWATKAGDPDGILYLMGEVADPTASLATAAVQTAYPLDWGFGGNLNDNLAVEDHSPAPQLTCISNAMHGGENREDGNFAGFLVAAVDHWLVWSLSGQPQYWPAKNTYRLPEPTLAVITIGTVSYAFTQTGVWMASGATDSSIQISKTRVDLGPMLAAGKSVVSTPYGILYVSREGVMLFDGRDATNLTREILPASVIQASTYWCASFVDDYYIFTDAAGATYKLDLRGFPGRLALIKAATTAQGSVLAFSRMPTISGVSEGLYAAYAGDSTLRPWRPDSGVSPATRQAAQHKTGKITFGDATRHKQLSKYRLDGNGPVTMKVWADPNDLTTDVTPTFSVTLNLPMREARWFPRTVAGKTFSFLFDVPSGSALAAGSHLEGVRHG